MPLLSRIPLSILFAAISSSLYADIPDIEVKTFVNSTGRTISYNWEPSTFANEADGPVLLMIHGGSWITGSKDDPYFYHRQADSENVTRIFFNLASIDYTLFQPLNLWDMNPWPTQLNDVIELVRHLRNENPDRKISLLGGSAGAHIAMATAVHFPNEIQCVTGVAGVYDFKEPSLNNFIPAWGPQLAAKLLRNTNSWTSPVDPQLNIPANYSVPTLLMHSPGDTIVNEQQSIGMYNELSDETKYPLAKAYYHEIEIDAHIPQMFGNPEDTEMAPYTSEFLLFSYFSGCL